MARPPLPDARFSTRPLPPVRDDAPAERDDDESLARTPADVIAMLGFDPLDEEEPA